MDANRRKNGGIYIFGSLRSHGYCINVETVRNINDWLLGSLRGPGL